MQVFSYTGKGQLMMDENVCITSYGNMVKFTHCDAPDTKWDYVREVDCIFDLNAYRF